MSATRHRILFAALGLICLTGAARVDYFLHGYYTPTAGKVGQHMTSDAAFGVADMPDQCAVEWKDIVIAGTLPPGMDIANSFSSVISGTPTTAGDFSATVTFHGLGCSAPPLAPADRVIQVIFHITP
jgi:hypothetical protein